MAIQLELTKRELCVLLDALVYLPQHAKYENGEQYDYFNLLKKADVALFNTLYDE